MLYPLRQSLSIASYSAKAGGTEDGGGIAPGASFPLGMRSRIHTPSSRSISSCRQNKCVNRYVACFVASIYVERSFVM